MHTVRDGMFEAMLNLLGIPVRFNNGYQLTEAETDEFNKNYAPHYSIGLIRPIRTV